MFAYLPFLWAALWRKPTRTVLAFVSVTTGIALFALALGAKAAFDAVRPDPFFGALTAGVAGVGLALILFLTASAVAHSVRERVPEFAILKTIGFSDGAIIGLVVAEAAMPFLFGTTAGLLLAKTLSLLLPFLLPAGTHFPSPIISAGLVSTAFALAGVLALLAAALPASRIGRIDIVTALQKD